MPPRPRLAPLSIRELLIHGERKESFADLGVLLTPLPDDYFSPARGGEALREFFGVETLAAYGCEDLPAAQAAAAARGRFPPDGREARTPTIVSMRSDCLTGLVR